MDMSTTTDTTMDMSTTTDMSTTVDTTMDMSTTTDTTMDMSTTTDMSATTTEMPTVTPMADEDEGSGSGSTAASGLGQGIILSESGSGLEGSAATEEVEEDDRVTKETVFQDENVLPVTTMKSVTEGPADATTTQSPEASEKKTKEK